MLCNYRAIPQLACYDNEPNADAAADADAAAAAAAAAAADVTKPTMFTQDQVNKFLAEDRRRNEAAHKAAQKQLLQKQEAEYNALLASKSLTEQERDALNESLESVQKQLLSEKEYAARELKKTQDALTAQKITAEQAAKDWETRYRDSAITRELLDAAAKNEAYNAAQMMRTLKSSAKLVPLDGSTGEFQVVVDLADEVDGKPVTTQLPPDAAMKRMKELPALYGNLFKANVVSGIGGNSNTAGQPAGHAGTPDFKNMTPAQYAKLRKEHPELVYGVK
jgi:uncharacterized FlaG/YvyC family protein